MKKLSFAAAFIAGLTGFFISNLAQAMPTLGDDVIFSSVRVSSGTVITGTFEMNLSAYNATTSTWTEKQITTENGVAKTQSQQISNSALLTDASVATMLANCASMGGTLQTLTVPAGTFPTCSMPSNSDFSNGTLWIAKGVVFGIVQEDFTTSDGTHTVLQLVSQTAGH